MKHLFTSMLASNPINIIFEMLEQVDLTVQHLIPLFDAWLSGDQAVVKENFKIIAHLEHEADKVKQRIRDQLATNLMIPLKRNDLLELISRLDSIADECEDIGALMTVRHTIVPEPMIIPFREFLTINLDAFNATKEMLSKLDEVVTSGFTGKVEQSIFQDCDIIGNLEWQADKKQYKLNQLMFEVCGEETPVNTLMLYNITKQTGGIADYCESLAKRLHSLLSEGKK